MWRTGSDPSAGTAGLTRAWTARPRRPRVGARLPRVDGWPKVAGSDKFGADEAPADALWMRVVRSPHARARFTLGDLQAVKARNSGLAAILTAADVPGENAFGIFPGMKDQPVLAPGLVRFRGEAVLALVGTRAAVESISDAKLPIEWTIEPPLSGIEAALAPGAPAIHDGVPDNVLARGNLKCGDVQRGHARAAATAEGSFETAFVEHAYIEPEAGFAVPIGTGPDRIEVTACTQAPYMDREETARVLGVEQSRVRIRPSACGGGFGGKLDVSVQPLLAVAAWVTGRPVRIVYTPHRVRWPRPPSGIRRASGPSRRPTRRAALPPSRCGPISTPAPTPPGGRRSPTACRCTAWAPTRCPTPGCARVRSTPTTRRPAPSAASACRRRRLRMRR